VAELEQNVLPQALEQYLRWRPRLSRMNEWRIVLPLPNLAWDVHSGFEQALSLTGVCGMSGPKVVSRVARERHKQYHASHFETR
jgi:hypothetical protein